MQNKENTSIEEIIAAIDNDFNLDNSDWIPRVAAWTIEVLNQLRCTVTEKKKVKIPVSGNIIVSDCEAFSGKFKLFDANGCEIEELESTSCGCTTTDDSNRFSGNFGTVVAIPQFNDKVTEDSNAVANSIIGYNLEGKFINSRIVERHKVGTLTLTPSHVKYTKISDNKIELTENMSYVYVIYNSTKTYKSEVYGCELPVIPNNGILKEAIKYYCMYKILCRGVKHPVFNLAASQYGTNPYYMWTQLKEKAKRSVIIDSQGDDLDDKGEWGKALINFTFD